MKYLIRKVIYSLVIISTIALSCSYISFISFASDTLNHSESSHALAESGCEPCYIVLGAGKNESSVSVTWYTTETEPCLLKLYDGQTTETYKSTSTPTCTPCENSYYQKHVVSLSGLSAGMTYTYSVSGTSSLNNPMWSAPYTFQTKDSGNRFHFIALGDSQQGSNHAEHDAMGWKITTDKALDKASDSSFAICMGDIISDHKDLPKMQSQYNSLFYTSNTALFTSMPFVAVVGNHDAWTDKTTQLFTEHFTNPNLSYRGSSADNVVGEEDFWFTRGNSLFIVLNTNNEDTEEHERFIAYAIHKNPNVKWKFVSMHHSIYSVARHSQDDNVLVLREKLSPIFQKYKIDVVFQGHDHVYTRSRMMGGTDGRSILSSDSDEEVRTIYTNPAGTLYLTLNSSSGSILYDAKDEYPYVAVSKQTESPNYTLVSVTTSKVRIKTYNSEDDSLIDEVTIRKMR